MVRKRSINHALPCMTECENQETVVLSVEQLHWLFDGIDLAVVLKHRPRYYALAGFNLVAAGRASIRPAIPRLPPYTLAL